jgi:hypothetical protein
MSVGTLLSVGTLFVCRNTFCFVCGNAFCLWERFFIYLFLESDCISQ